MRQTKIHQLRSIFRTLPGFAISDPRRRASWRQFKKDYLANPRPDRFAYMAELRRQAANLNMAETAVTT